ncbi:MAG: lipid II flippase Amj [Candidatus Elarobacter sp.]
MTGVLVTNLFIAAGLNLLTQAIQIGAYAARVAGVTTGRIATAISLFSLVVTASRLANLVVTPALGALADTPANAARGMHELAKGALKLQQAAVTPEQLHVFDTQMRIIVAAGSLGILLGGLMMPVFIMMFVRGVRSFERLGSIPAALMRLFDPRVIRDVLGSFRLPSLRDARALPFGAIPRKLIIGNTVIMMVYAIGVVAAYYASVLNLEARGTAIGLSGLVNGVGTIAFSLFVDPTSSYIVDQTARNERPVSHVYAMIVALTASAFVGTILAQLILFPAAQYIAAASHIFKHS